MTSKHEAEAEAQAAPSLPKAPAAVGIRHLLCFMLFLNLAMIYVIRVILSVTIVAMCSDCNKNNNNNDKFPSYEWSDYKDTMLSSFFWGYVVTQVPSGMLAHRWGGKPLLVVAVGVSSVVTLLTPLLAEGGWGWVCAGRIVQGLSQGSVLPSIHTLLAKWAPPQERGRLSTYVYAGAQLGTVIALPVAGVLSESSIGWPSVFYIFGSVGVVVTVAWFLLASNSPATHRWCSEAERHYIESSFGDTSNAVNPPTPWKEIFTSIPMWALIIVHCGQNWGFWTLLTEMPSYMDGVLGFDLRSNGLLSALPYLVMWLLSFVFSWASDFANKKKWLSVSVSRKLFNSIGHWGPALALLGVGYVTDEAAAVGLLTVAVGLGASVYLGFQINHIDLSPNFAGTMMGITNSFANIMSIVGPLVVGVIVTDSTSREQWRTVFFITSGIYFVGNLLFILFGTGEIQPWNTSTQKEDKDVYENSANTKEKSMSVHEKTEDKKEKF